MENHLLRIVASKANKGSIILDNYIDLNVKNMFYYSSNKNLELTTIDMYEIGYRGKLSKQLHVDMEAFYQIAKDYTSAIVVDSVVAGPTPFTGKTYMSAHNLGISPVQYGISLSLFYQASKQLLFKPFITWQHTDINDFMPDTKKPDSLITKSHDWTPTYYYGITANYTATDKLNISINMYGFSQMFFEYAGAYTQKDVIGDKLLLNIKTSYNIANNLSVYINLRNLNVLTQIKNDKFSNKTERQFGFADSIKPSFLFGLAYNY